MLFDFRLVPLDVIEPWGSPEEPTLNWFGLTDGQYWMNVGASRLFEYSDAAQQSGAPRFCSYQVARLYEDVVEAFPHIMEPVPADLISHLTGTGRWRTTDCLAAWAEMQSELDDGYWSTVENAVTWVGRREISTAHLSPSVDWVIWSDEADVYIEWDNRAKVFQGAHAWSANHGSFSIQREHFAEEVRNFQARLMQAMAERVQAVIAGGLPAPIHINLSGLLKEQRTRAGDWDLTLAQPPTDWNAVRQALDAIGA